MSVKVFILGRPGSGKSSAAKYIVKRLQAGGWSSHRFKDYEILDRMSREDVSQERFQRANGGFDLKDVLAFDDALKELENEVFEYISNIAEDEFILIEFARMNYLKSFKLLSPNFLQDAYFLFIDAKFGICTKRVHDRMNNPKDADDHYISYSVLRKHYHRQYFPRHGELKNSWIVKNQSTWSSFTKKIDDVVDSILKDV